jgi:hypothetical protein
MLVRKLTYTPKSALSMGVDYAQVSLRINTSLNEFLTRTQSRFPHRDLFIPLISYFEYSQLRDSKYASPSTAFDVLRSSVIKIASGQRPFDARLGKCFQTPGSRLNAIKIVFEADEISDLKRRLNDAGIFQSRMIDRQGYLQVRIKSGTTIANNLESQEVEDVLKELNDDLLHCSDGPGTVRVEGMSLRIMCRISNPSKDILVCPWEAFPFHADQIELQAQDELRDPR